MDELLMDGFHVGWVPCGAQRQGLGRCGGIGVPRLASQLAKASNFSELTETGGYLVVKGGRLSEDGKRGSACPSPARDHAQGGAMFREGPCSVPVASALQECGPRVARSSRF